MEQIKSFEESKRIDLKAIAEYVIEEIHAKGWKISVNPDQSWDMLMKRQSKQYPVTFIPINDIEVYDTTQRNRCDIANSQVIKKMEQKFDSILFMPCHIALYVDKRGNQHLINVDGQGRQIYAIMHGFPSLPCIVQTVESWEEVCTLFFKYNNQNNFESVKKPGKWEVLLNQGDKDVVEDYELIKQWFTGGIQLPGSVITNNIEEDVFTKADFTEFLKYTSFKEGSDSRICFEERLMDRKLMIAPYFLMRKTFGEGRSFKHWSLGLNMIYKALKNVCAEMHADCNQKFKSMFVYSSKNPITNIGNTRRVYFCGKDSKPTIALSNEDFGLQMLQLCNECGIISDEWLKGRSSIYTKVLNCLKSWAKSNVK